MKVLQLHGRKTLASDADVIFRRNEPTYNNLFFLLQTQPKYLARLSILLCTPAQKRTFTQLIQQLFRGTPAGDQREECLLLTYYQYALREEWQSQTTIDISGMKRMPPKLRRGDSVNVGLLQLYLRRPECTKALKMVLEPVLELLMNDLRLGFGLVNMTADPLAILKA